MHHVAPLDDAPLETRLQCPACSTPGTRFRSPDEILRDLHLARRWWENRATATDLPLQWPVHGEPAAIWGCRACGSLWRATPGLRSGMAERYRHDRYEPETLRRLHRAGYRELAADRDWFVGHGLRPGSRVLEVGSYVGAFLRLAGELGCDAHGVDVGVDTSSFCRALGFDVSRGELADREGDVDYDSVWILNCFDQLADPHATLATVATLLRPGGRVVIHTPDADVVRDAYLRGGETTRETALDDHLWGVPFLSCFTRKALDDMLVGAGFEPQPCRDRGGDGDGLRASWFDAIGRR